MVHGNAFKPKLGLNREVEGVAGAQTGNTVRASLFQRPDPELGWDEGLLASTAWQHGRGPIRRPPAASGIIHTLY